MRAQTRLRSPACSNQRWQWPDRGGPPSRVKSSDSTGCEEASCLLGGALCYLQQHRLSLRVQHLRNLLQAGLMQSKSINVSRRIHLTLQWTLPCLQQHCRACGSATVRCLMLLLACLRVTAGLSNSFTAYFIDLIKPASIELCDVVGNDCPHDPLSNHAKARTTPLLRTQVLCCLRACLQLEVLVLSSAEPAEANLEPGH